MFCISILATVLTVVHATLTVEPNNTVADVGNTVILPCETTETIPPTWTLYRTDGTLCIVYDGGSPSCVDSRFSVTPNNGHYDLKITNLQSVDANTYGCSDSADSAIAVLGVVEVKPKLNIVPSGCLRDGATVEVRCEMTYNGSDLMSPVLTLTGGSSMPETGSSGNVFWSNVSVTASRNKTEFTCIASFNPPTCSPLPGGAPPTSSCTTNVPDYPKDLQTLAVEVSRCPRYAVTIKSDNENETFTGGNTTASTNLTCRAVDGSSDVIANYSWTDEAGNIVSATSSLTLPAAEGQYDYICVVSSYRNCSGIIEQCCELAQLVHVNTLTGNPLSCEPSCGFNECTECCVPAIVLAVVIVIILVAGVVLWFVWLLPMKKALEVAASAATAAATVATETNHTAAASSTAATARQ